MWIGGYAAKKKCGKNVEGLGSDTTAGSTSTAWRCNYRTCRKPRIVVGTRRRAVVCTMVTAYRVCLLRSLRMWFDLCRGGLDRIGEIKECWLFLRPVLGAGCAAMPTTPADGKQLRNLDIDPNALMPISPDAGVCKKTPEPYEVCALATDGLVCKTEPRHRQCG